VRDIWLYLDSGPGSASWNMALDEALLESGPRLERPILRFYAWTEPAASFGYFQKYAEVERLTPLRPLVRRPTAGGLVPHAADWTYSLIFPPSHPWYGLLATESYCRVHSLLKQAFAILDLSTELAPAQLKSAPGQCFVGHEQADLLFRGRKIAGAAQRRRKDGLLIQGSVQPPGWTVGRNDWQHALRRAIEQDCGVNWQEYSLEAIIQRRAGELSALKYSLAGYNQRR
jgi:lipoyl(octanoyl) transferase